MISKKFGRKKKAANNEGRATKVTSIMISQELKVKLSELKDAYCAYYQNTVTYDQMLERWASQVKRFDPQVFAPNAQENRDNAQKSAAGEAEKKKMSKIPSDSAKALKSLKNEEIRARAEEELDAWFAEQTEAERNDPAAILKNFRLLTDFALKDEDKKYTDLEFGSILQVGKPEKFLQLYDFEDQAVSPEEKEKSARLLATYRRRLDAELEDKIRQEKEEKERREAEERRREEERIAALKAPYRMSSADTKAYYRYKDEASQEDLGKRVAAALKRLPDKEQITIDGKGLWATDGELIFSVRKDGRFKKVTNWDGAVKQPETLHYKIFLKEINSLP